MASSSETEYWRTRWSTSNPLSVIFTPVHTADELYTLVCVYKSMRLKRRCTVFLWGFGEARHIHHQLYWQNTTKIYNYCGILWSTLLWYPYQIPSLYHGTPTAHFCRVFKEAALFFPVSLNAAEGVLQRFSSALAMSRCLFKFRWGLDNGDQTVNNHPDKLSCSPLISYSLWCEREPEVFSAA